MTPDEFWQQIVLNIDLFASITGFGLLVFASGYGVGYIRYTVRRTVSTAT
ncbi:hypothetical protein [Shewanella algae]|nr:hypothetical protein [Shewanella algae]MBO2600779.1 hypothetical protein [Shewanella algae]MBO2600790.1 hypothetical protein [Shewanella algae]